MLHVAGEDRDVFVTCGRGEPEVGDANRATGALECGGDFRIGEQVAAGEAEPGIRTEKAADGVGCDALIDGPVQELGLHHPQQDWAITGALRIEIGEPLRMAAAAPEIDEDRGVG